MTQTVNSLTHEVSVLPSYRTSQLICTANQLTGFYMRATLAVNELNAKVTIICKSIDWFLYDGDFGV